MADDIEQEELNQAAYIETAYSDYSISREIGDDWYDRGESAVLWVPSVVSPYESNLLFNQQPADFSRIVVHQPTPAHVDPRLWHRS
jgi:RES domain-containing protein